MSQPPTNKQFTNWKRDAFLDNPITSNQSIDLSLNRDAFWALNPSYTEKIKWRMQNDHNPQYSMLADKLAVKEYAQQFNIPIIPTAYQTPHPASIPFDKLPENCIVKANHGCKWNILRFNNEFYRFVGLENASRKVNHKQLAARKVSERFVVEYFQRLMSTIYDRHGERYYYDIPPHTFVEELLLTEQNYLPVDLKAYTFNGYTKGYWFGFWGIHMIFLDENFNVLYEIGDGYKNEFDKISNIEQIKQWSYDISKDFDHMRVDFLITDDSCVLNEITISDSAGNNFPYVKDFYDYVGEFWK
jgi:hypothetical protein